MYQIKEKLKDGRVVILCVVSSKQDAESRVSSAKRENRDVWYVKE